MLTLPKLVSIYNKWKSEIMRTQNSQDWNMKTLTFYYNCSKWLTQKEVGKSQT